MPTPMTEHYPTLIEMAPRHKSYPVSWKDGWNIFRGPKLWSSAPDDYVVVRSNEPKVLFSSVLDEAIEQWCQYVVVLFDGTDHGDTTNEIRQCADTLEQLDPQKIDVLIVTEFYQEGSYDVVDNLLWDLDGALAKKYGASWQSVYVLNTEKQIIYKSSGIMKDKLSYFLFQQLKKA